ncbi:HGGxSTG domain-containing protein [Hyphomonas sp.]|uniref:HGGxSTG domain-containing protein n=1 Tax=Hyphomonas sp. TaxID=87 RepID=UPI003F7251CB
MNSRTVIECICGARTRAGVPCKARPMRNGRCRMHGGTSPGAQKGNRNAWKHGQYSAETVALKLLTKAALSSSS